MNDRLDTAYSKLGLREPFIAAVMTRIKREVSDEVSTAATDGTRVIYNPDFIEKQSNEELFGLVLHESLHIVLMHMWRRDGRDPELWNYANDAIINAYIRKRGYSLPDGGVFVSWVQDSHDSEHVYRKLKQEQDRQEQSGSGSGGEGDGEGDQQSKPKRAGGFDGQGDLIDAPNEATKSDLEATIMASAEMAKACGDNSGLIDNILKRAGKSDIDWRNEMRAMLTAASNNDYTYRRPSRRFIAQGLYLPSLHNEGLGPVVIAVDSSASMTQQELSQIAEETQQIIEDLNPEFVRVVYCDTSIKNIQDFNQGDDVKLECRGGGGTSFKPVFDYVSSEMPNAVGVIYFTDMEANLEECDEPHCPVIWANTGKQINEVPFGVITNVKI